MQLAESAKASAMSDASAVIGECGAIMRDLVAPVRAEQGSAKAAWHAVARRLGMKPRRVRSYLNGEVRAVQAWEADRLREAWQRARTDRIARLEAELAHLKQERLGDDASTAVAGGDPARLGHGVDLGRRTMRTARPQAGSPRGPHFQLTTKARARG